MRKIFILLFLTSFHIYGQNEKRIQTLQNNLEILAVENDALNQPLKFKFDVNQGRISVASFLLAVSKLHNLNITIDETLKDRYITSQFSNASVSDVLIFLCKEENLEIEFTGDILSFSPYTPPVKEEVPLPEIVEYNSENKTVFIDIQKAPLHRIFKKLSLQTGINLLFGNGMENIPLTLFVQNTSPEKAIEQMAFAHQLKFTKTDEGFYLFELSDGKASSQFQRRNFNAETKGYEILDTLNKRIRINVEKAPLVELIEALTYDLKLDFYIASPLENLGNITFKANNIFFDDFLINAFNSLESRARPTTNNQNQSASTQSSNNSNSNSNNTITFKKGSGNIYFFGVEELVSLHSVATIPLQYRSIEMLGEPHKENSNVLVAPTTNFQGNFGGSQGFGSSLGAGTGIGNRTNLSNARFSNTSNANSSEAKKPQVTLESLIPEALKSRLEIKADTELNSFLVSGKYTDIERFRTFVSSIDKPVPVVLIEVMFIEVNKSNRVETGISWGLGEAETTTQGTLFPSADLTLNATTVNRIIGGFDAFGTLNLGKVVPEFFAKLKALEQSGTIKIMSTPKMATLNGHRALFSNNQTSYYVVTNQNFYGVQIPQSSEIRNYYPIQAGLTLSIKPFISGNDQITLDIYVSQSTFNNERIAEDAPPGLEAREFSSIVRIQDRDVVILGGLEQKSRDNSGSGVPFLARIPLVKWLFSERVRSGVQRKLTVLIKPTRID